MRIERKQRRVFVLLLVVLVAAASLGIVQIGALAAGLSWGGSTVYAGEEPTPTPTLIVTPPAPGEGNCGANGCGG
jgi:hypothetical protein